MTRATGDNSPNQTVECVFMPLYIYNIKKSLSIIYTEETPFQGDSPHQFDDVQVFISRKCGNGPTASPQQPDCFASIARLVSRKSPSAPLRLPEGFDSIARKVTRSSRRAFGGGASGIWARGVGDLGAGRRDFDFRRGGWHRRTRCPSDQSFRRAMPRSFTITAGK